MIKYLRIFLFLFTVQTTFAQVTTGTLKGIITDLTGETLTGATVIATHLPSGAVYSTLSGSDGQYSIPHLKTGGPYTIKVTFVGYSTRLVNNVSVQSGPAMKIDIVLKEYPRLLYNVTVAASKGDIINPANNGPSTIVTPHEIQNLPIVNDTYADFARITPQANVLRGTTDVTPLGISYAGQNNKYNLFTIDGAKSVNAFDLYSSGTSINPIPLQSVQAMQILLSPYDVIHGRFIGGDINIITKSATNDFRGSAYGYLQDQHLLVNSAPNGLSKILGFDLGGPVIKNKLFFFVNIENAGHFNVVGYDPTQAGSGSKFEPDVLQGLVNYVQKKYGFDIGSYSAINSTVSSNSALGKIDWNIDGKNKLTFRNSYVNGQNFVIGRSPAILTFGNSAYNINTGTNSTVVELNSAIADHSSNVFRMSYNYIKNSQNTADFPSININSGGLIYNLGSDYTASASSSVQKDFDIVDYFNLYKGKHTFTFGTDDELFSLTNIFLPAFNGYYVYNSVAAFETDASPVNYSVGYSTKGGVDKAPATMRAGQLSAYGQDGWEVNNQLRVVYGLRIDLPLFFNEPGVNVAFNSSSIAETNGVATDKTPKLKPEISPRAGFNYDVFDDQTTQLRGGAGIFTGDIPYFWISNQYANTGINSIKFTGVPDGLTFNYNPNQPHLGAYIPPNAATAPTEIDVTDPDFKLPQQLHTNLALDRKLLYGVVGTFEVIYSKTISDILYENLNLGNPAGAITLGNTTRPYYNFKYLNTNYADVIELTNTNKGHAYDFTLRLKKLFTDGWSAMAAYTFGHSYSVNDGTGSTSIVNWRTAYSTNGSNNPDESNSNFDLGSRIISYYSKTFADPQSRWSTVIGLVYSWQTGQRYSYLYNFNVSGDGVSDRYIATDMVYIPTDASQFVAFSRVVNGVASTVTPAQQLSDLQAFIADNADLQKYKGENTPRNGFSLPWENHVDLRLAEDLGMERNHKLQTGIAILNAANLLDKNWGRVYYMPDEEYSLFNVVSDTNDPKFTFDSSRLNTVDGRLRAYAIDEINSKWRAQLEVSYTF